jgi:hypothetical protein
MRIVFHGFDQIEASAKGFTRAAENYYALGRFRRCTLEGGCQIAHEFNCKGIPAFRPVQREERDLRRLFFDENDWHDLT